mmetsp:Transcript_118251/g.334212  ORF Transcript_118251/g.334212 Transcript_118251/m.334212 type:complete len:248 (+) Transcript_118251:26-769(+)
MCAWVQMPIWSASLGDSLLLAATGPIARERPSPQVPATWTRTRSPEESSPASGRVPSKPSREKFQASRVATPATLDTKAPRSYTVNTSGSPTRHSSSNVSPQQGSSVSGTSKVSQYVPVPFTSHRHQKLSPVQFKETSPVAFSTKTSRVCVVAFRSSVTSRHAWDGRAAVWMRIAASSSSVELASSISTAGPGSGGFVGGASACDGLVRPAIKASRSESTWTSSFASRSARKASHVSASGSALQPDS